MPWERRRPAAVRNRRPPFATLAALCEVLKCQPGDLLRWEAEDGPTTATSPGGKVLRSHGPPDTSSG
jgi:hypothetical protein